MIGRVLAVAGSDSGGGAGIQADIKTITVLGGYAMTAVTAVTAQDTHGVHGVVALPPDFVALQMRLVLDDIGADVVKTGMLVDAATIDAVCDVLERHPGLPVVVDPVMLATSGRALLDASGRNRLRTRLLPLTHLLTPNLPEAESLTGMTIADANDMREAARKLLAWVPAVLLKGGHLPGDDLVDILATRERVVEFSSRRLVTRHTHGTGCTLASGIAVGLAQGMALPDAVARAAAYLRAAIAAAPGFGAGHGPIDHTVKIGECHA